MSAPSEVQQRRFTVVDTRGRRASHASQLNSAAEFGFDETVQLADAFNEAQQEFAASHDPVSLEKKTKEAEEAMLRRRKEHRIMALILVAEARRYQRESLLRAKAAYQRAKEGRRYTAARFCPPHPVCDLNSRKIYKAMVHDVALLLHDGMPNDYYAHTMEQLGRARLFQFA